MSTPVRNARAADLVRYFVRRFSGKLGRTKLAKLIYLADLESRRHLGRPISDLQYKLNNNGPFDNALLGIIRERCDAKEISEEHFPVGAGFGYRYHWAGSTGPSFDRAEAAILAYVAETYAPMELDALLQDVVYETEPMRRVEKKPLGERIPMEVVDNAARLELGGVNLADALRAEEQVREGKTIPWESLKRELRDRDSRDRR